jgi:hypothetical protein
MPFTNLITIDKTFSEMGDMSVIRAWLAGRLSTSDVAHFSQAVKDRTRTNPSPVYESAHRFFAEKMSTTINTSLSAVNSSVVWEHGTHSDAPAKPNPCN